MKVEKVEKVEIITFDMLKAGDVFVFEDSIYLKLDDVNESGEKIAFCFDSNTTGYFLGEDIVVEVNAKVVI